MKTKEITKEANGVVKDIFGPLIRNGTKEEWKKGLDFINGQIDLYEVIRGQKMFVWRKIRIIMNNKFGKKFIGKENI